MAVLPITNVVNVSITNTPSGLSEKNVNSLGLFTTESPSNIDPFTIYVSAAQVAEDYGTSSETAQMANAIFAQTPNLRTGNGRLVILPLESAVSATQGDFETANISANLVDIILVSNGDLEVTVDGVSIDLTNLDFTAAENLADVAEILDNKLQDVIVEAVSTTGLKFISKKVGDDSDVSISAVSGGSGTDLAGAGYLNAAAGTATSGVNSSGETILDAIARTEGNVSYVGVITNLQLEDNALEAVSDGIQAQDRIFVHHVSSSDDIDGIGTTIKDSGNDKTRLILYTESPAEANLVKSAYAGRAFSVNYSGSFTTQTMNLKQLATVTPDLGISQTLYSEADAAGLDLYVSYEGVPSVLSSGGNDFFDNVYADLALKFALETAGFNYLRQTNTKVPQTEQGMNGLKGSYAQVCERFVRNGAIAGGSWNSSETFGDPEIFKQNVLDTGYYIYSLPITQQSSVERDARKAPLVQIAVKRAGAIHTSDVLVLINN